MNTVRVRLTLFMLLTLGLTASFGYLAYSAQKNYSAHIQQMELSLEIIDFSKRVLRRSIDDKSLRKLQVYRKSIQQKNRQKALSDVIAAYSGGNRQTAYSRLDFFEKNESAYREYLAPQLSYLRKRFVFYTLLAVATIFFSMSVVLIYLNRSVFNPIRDLNRKMVDFLNHKYTYRFTVPASNEIGSLQGTFNSLAQQVLTNMEELKALDRAKSDFLSIASHELRTPLTSIKGSLSLLNQGVAGDINEAAKNLIHIAENETDRLIRLINDILDLAKIEARKFPLNKDWYSLDEVVEQTLDGLSGLASAANVRLVKNDCSDVKVLIDSDRIRQVLTNLLSNAIKYSPKNGEVSVLCSSNEEQHLYVEVTDQGKGIAPEDQELIFQKFRQATSPQNPLVKGTGLGLAIAKALIEEHEGELGVRSSPGNGCTFYFTLPKWKIEDVDENLTLPEAA